MRKLFPLLLCLPVFLMYFVFKKEEVKTEVKQAERKLAGTKPQSDKSKKPPIHQINPRAQKLFQRRTPVDNFIVNRIPQSLENIFEKDVNVKLTKGHVYLKNVAATPKEDYQTSFGEEVYQDDLYVYFLTAGEHAFIPVALMKSVNRPYPISSIIHVRNATAEVRQELLSLGLTEYYYNSSIKLLSLDSKSENVLEFYTDLADKGYEVELEVLKPMPVAI